MSTNRRSRSRAGLLAMVAVALLCCVAAACGSDSPPEARSAMEPPMTGSTASHQEDRIPIEVAIGESWYVVHASAAAMEDVVRVLCLHRPDPVCEGEIAEENIRFEPDVTPLPGSSGAANCITAVCHQRLENCAGFLMLENAEAPRQLQIAIEHMYLDQLGILQTDWEGIPHSAGFPVSISGIRFQPLAASGRAAALRNSMNHFAESARVARLILREENMSESCKDRFPMAGPTGLGDGPDGPYTWEELYVSMFNDAMQAYSSTSQRVMGAMVDAADSQLRGTTLPLQEIATQWHGRVDSRSGAARLLGFGSIQDEVQIRQDGCGLGFASQLRPTEGVVCPAIRGNAGVKKAIDVVRSLRISPDPALYSQAELDDVAFDAVIEDRQMMGLSTDFTKSEWMLSEGITAKDMKLARNYLCAEASVNATKFTEIGGTTVPRFFGTEGPRPLPPGVRTANFLGAYDRGDDSSVDSDEYVGGGAIRTIDQMRRTAIGVKSKYAGTSAVGALDATFELAKAAEIEVGAARLEILVGTETSGNLDRIKVGVHGASQNRHLLVQGEEGMKCLTTGTIDGAPCVQSDYLIDFTALAGALASPEDMTDLTGGAASPYLELTSVPQPGNPTSPIVAGRTIYLIEESDGQRQVVTGAVPDAGEASLPGGFTKRAVVPYGGLMQVSLAAMIRPALEDCSLPERTCAGLPASIWPPLESEISGEETGQTYERSWKYWLEAARAAADEADRRAEDLIAHGLRMDEIAQRADDAVLAACGESVGDLENPCDSIEEAPWVTFGDEPVRVAVLTVDNSRTRAIPKSSSFTAPSFVTKTFSGLISRWIMPLAFAAASMSSSW